MYNSGLLGGLLQIVLGDRQRTFFLSQFLVEEDASLSRLSGCQMRIHGIKFIHISVRHFASAVRIAVVHNDVNQTIFASKKTRIALQDSARILHLSRLV